MGKRAASIIIGALVLVGILVIAWKFGHSSAPSQTAFNNTPIATPTTPPASPTTTSPQTPPTPPGTVPPPCGDGSLAQYAGTMCSLTAPLAPYNVVIYKWPSVADIYSCVSNPASICANPAMSVNNVEITPDPHPTNNSTLLVGHFDFPGCPTLNDGPDTLTHPTLCVTAGQSVTVTINGSVVSGAYVNADWPHDQFQTGNGSVQETLLIETSPPATSVTGCNQSPCQDVDSKDIEFPDTSFPFVVTFQLNGNQGTAGVYSLGIHPTVPKASGPN